MRHRRIVFELHRTARNISTFWPDLQREGNVCLICRMGLFSLVPGMRRRIMRLQIKDAALEP